jgi:glycosyltransferase involved in cell wall biosynthesis
MRLKLFEKNEIFIFLIGFYKWYTHANQYYFPKELAEYYKVNVVEFPQFNKFLKVLTGKIQIVENIKKNLSVVHSFGILPRGRSIPSINHLNFQILKSFLDRKYQFSNKKYKIITFTPEIYHLLSDKDTHEIFYYVLDDYTSYPILDSFMQKKQFLSLEQRILSKLKGIITSSISLYEKYRKLHPNTIYFPNPVNLDTFLSFDKKNAAVPYDLKNIQHPIVGYVGDIETYRIDFDLINYLADCFPDVSFIFIGPVGIHDHIAYKFIPKRKNIYYLGLKKRDVLPGYINQFDVCIIPFKKNIYTQMSFPLKTFEYLSLGKPVVSTALSSIAHLIKDRVIYWSSDRVKFVNNLKRSLSENKNSTLIRKRIYIARENSWKKRIEELIKIIR